MILCKTILIIIYCHGKYTEISSEQQSTVVFHEMQKITNKNSWLQNYEKNH